MAIYYPESNLQIMDYNRVLKSINDMSADEFISKISDSYDIDAYPDGSTNFKPTQKGECSLYIKNKWFRLSVKSEKIDESNLIKMLDSQLLTDLVLAPILGITDLRGDDRIDFVGGIRGLKELEKRFNEDCVAAFAMYPV
jgi:uncharacterized protein (DUF1015 family)